MRALKYLAFFLLFIFWKCASPQPLTGGAKDETPPKIIEAESTPNKQTSFKQKEITITFDEWIQLKDVDAQLVISPLMPAKPEIKQKGKSIIITLPDSLRENTTYSLNFGSAIQDLNENNKLENYSFVFSTGTFLDSITLSGKVMDAVSLKPAPDVWVMLYPTGDDSLVYKQKPEYLAKTGKEGQWSISNIREDSFLVVALKDENLNFIYDQETELFGWLDTIVKTTVSKTLPDIVVSPREKKSVLQDVRHVAPGYLKVIIPGPTPKPVPTFEPSFQNAITEWELDTLHLWYDPATNYAGRVILGTDTTRIRASDGESLNSSRLIITGASGRLHPAEEAKLKASAPIQVIDTSLIQLNKDTVENIPFSIRMDSVSRRLFWVKANWVPPSRYVMKFMRGAITDIWGRSNDTFNFSFVVNALDQFSNLEMKLSGLDSTQQYIIFLKTGETIQRSFIVTNQSSLIIPTKGLAPGKYTIEMIEDSNKNGLWDTGVFASRRQPERKKIFTPDNFRASWDVEVEMKW